MCIFCGSQCGGLGEILISLGLPFLGIYLFRMKKFLVKLKDNILCKSREEIQERANTCACCGESLIDGPNRVSPIRPEFQLDQLSELSVAAAQNNSEKLTKENAEGVRGWLLLLCLNLVIFIPAFNFYQISCILNLLFLPKNRVLLSIWSQGYYYLNIVMIFPMLFVALFSFYSGLQLWSIKEGAVKTAKKFLIVQLFLTLFLLVLHQLMLPLRNSIRDVAILITAQVLPSVLYFSVWYAYLMKSRRVKNTYGQAKRRTMAPRAGLKASAEITRGILVIHSEKVLP